MKICITANSLVYTKDLTYVNEIKILGHMTKDILIKF